MRDEVVYCQINKDYPYWIEKRRIGQQEGGHVAGLLSHWQDGQVRMNILFDAGLGTLEGIADSCDDSFWDKPLAVFITHGHIDHHAELMILSEIYCKRRGKNIHDRRLPVQVFCTGETQEHLNRTHRYGYRDGGTLEHRPIVPGSPVIRGLFQITPVTVDHFEGAVIYAVEFGKHKIVIGWDLRSLPLAAPQITHLKKPSLALFDATTWTPMVQDTGHTSIEELGKSGFLDQIQLQFDPAEEKYGAYLVHYSGWEDPWGMLTDEQLKEKFDHEFPAFSNVVRVAGRGQRWHFSL